MDKHLLYQMLRIRMVEEAIALEYPKQEMRCPTHLCIGQEAIAVGVCAVLGKEDAVFSTHRSHGHYLARGGSLPAMIAELYGKAGGCAGGIGGSQHLVDLSVNFLGAAPIVASTIPIAVGVALSVAMKKEQRIVVTFFGDAAVEEGVFAESVNVAVLRRLPVLFVCENNLYSTNTPIRDRQPDRPIYTMTAGMGMRSHQEDGNCVKKVFALSKRVIAQVRRGNGPQCIEFFTYRTFEHCGPNEDPVGYRPKDEKQHWKLNDPLRGIHGKDFETMKRQIQKEIDAAFAFAKRSPFPNPSLTSDVVWAPR